MYYYILIITILRKIFSFTIFTINIEDLFMWRDTPPISTIEPLTWGGARRFVASFHQMSIQMAAVLSRSKIVFLISTVIKLLFAFGD